MATKIYLVKRHKKAKKANGRREYTWALRWKENGALRCESTGTADKTQAQALADIKWAEVNIPAAAPPPPPPRVVKATWEECRTALERAMRLDNRRRSYINDALLMFDSLKKMFPAVEFPADLTPEDANNWKQRRLETPGKNGLPLSGYTIKGDLSTLKAIFRRWLRAECGLLTSNPFEDVQPPKCDELDPRIVKPAEFDAFLKWLGEEWNNWKLPEIYVRVADRTGWRATEIASMATSDILPGGLVRIVAANSKNRDDKVGCLPESLHADLLACAADGWAFGGFSTELSRRLILVKGQPHIAASVKSFSPARLVNWMQGQLQLFHEKAAKKAQDRGEHHEAFTLHDLRRTTISGLLQSGVSEKDVSVMVGATPEVIRKHYEKLNKAAIAINGSQQRMRAESESTTNLARPVRAEETA